VLDFPIIPQISIQKAWFWNEL